MIDRLLFPKDGFCYVCSDESNNLTHSLCMECRSRIEEIHKEFRLDSPYIDRCYSSLFYNNFTKDSIHRFKFEDRSYLYRTFHSYMLKTMEMNKIKDFDIIIPVPVHWRKEAIRGYNQAYLLAKPLAMKLDKPILRDCLVKSKWTREQNTLSAYERKRNLLDSFKVRRRERIQGMRILLIDDIFTTGSTLKVCSETLMKAGAESVFALTLTSTKM
ncbi:MAG: ComF family protein [Gudongella sp.]|nr:ComF family protein [Gudongella sp.]